MFSVLLIWATVEIPPPQHIKHYSFSSTIKNVFKLEACPHSCSSETGFRTMVQQKYKLEREGNLFFLLNWQTHKAAVTSKILGKRER